MNSLKAQIGDYIRIDDCVARVDAINRFSDTETEYLLDNGTAIDDRDVHFDDVLLESEVCFG